MFELEESPLEVESGGKAGEGAVGAEDAMAGNDEQEPVAGDGGADGAGGCGAPCAGGDVGGELLVKGGEHHVTFIIAFPSEALNDKYFLY